MPALRLDRHKGAEGDGHHHLEDRGAWRQAEEVTIKIFVCRQCGRTFNEMEGRGEE